MFLARIFRTCFRIRKQIRAKKLPVTFWLGLRDAKILVLWDGLVLGDVLVLADGVEVRGWG
jgi:hypothetical protein